MDELALAQRNGDALGIRSGGRGPKFHSIGRDGAEQEKRSREHRLSGSGACEERPTARRSMPSDARRSPGRL